MSSGRTPRGANPPVASRRAGFATAIACLLLAWPEAAGARREPGAARRIDPAAIAAARRYLCPHGGMPMRGRCRGGSASIAADTLPPGWWDGGLAPPARRQSPCPEGTVAIPALARADSVRCLPQ